MASLWSLLVGLSFLLAAGVSLSLAGWLLSRKAKRGPAAIAEASALVLTACWALATFALGSTAVATGVLHSLTYLGWLWMLHRLFAHDQRDKSVGPVRPVVLSLVFVELMQFALLALHLDYGDSSPAQVVISGFGVNLRLLTCAGALVLVHNLYAGAPSQARHALGWPAAALALLWLYDLNLSTVAYLGGSTPDVLTALRGAVMVAVVGILAIGAMRHDGSLRFGPSRSFAFRSFSLLVIGVYLFGMVLVSQGLSYAGGEWARLTQAGFLALTGALSLAVLPSPRLRRWLRVTLSKHLFQHRYDYRAEWQRFTGTIGRAGPASPSLSERVVQAVADITDSPAGLLLTPGEDGGLALEARWQWPAIDVPTKALDTVGARFFEQSQFIVDLDDLRREPVEGVPTAAVPDWLIDEPNAWAMVPLLHYERLAGLVVLARPTPARRLDWEDFDLLRVVGRQLASYLAEQASRDALGEAQRFDEFNRRIAFVMHDIKNLASQLSLLARNAEKHADNPEFRADMLLTLRNSADKLQALLSRLGRYGTHSVEKLMIVELNQIAAEVARSCQDQREVVVIDEASCTVMADREGLEQALLHLVQNAVDASSEGTPVFIAVRSEPAHAVVEVTDSGCGMSPEFVRNRLFRPFQSSKPGGFGIGAYEARELIRRMNGGLEVESREGLGTRFILRFPHFEAAQIMRSIQSRGTAAA